MSALDMASWILCTVAALQLGIWGAFSYDVLGILGGLTKFVNIIIGLAGLLSVWHLFKHLNK